MKKIIPFLLVLFCSTLLLGQKNKKEVKNFVSELDQKIPQLLTDFGVPGAAIVIIENGEPVLQKGYGLAHIEKGVPVNNQTGFNIGSISKTVAAWGVMKLVEEGKLSLDAPAEKYLTRWHLPDSDFDKNKVTIRRLLSHTAGLSLHGYPGWSPSDTLSTVEESLDGRNNGPGRVEIIMEPGTQWKYSGGGFTILQLLIEEVTGQEFANYMQENVLDPLGMTNSSYNISSHIMNASSQEHDAFGNVIDFELFTAEAAAGLHTTIEDFTKFVLASLPSFSSSSQGVLKSGTIKEMLTPAPASQGSYGLGYSVDTIQGTKTVMMGHGGANTGWHAYFKVNPLTNDGFAMMTNGGTGYNIYRQAFCDWTYWKTGSKGGDRCVIKPSISSKLKQIIESHGITAASEKYWQLKEKKSDQLNFGERELNNLGYHYLFNDQLENALAVFSINVKAYPEAFNVYDSMGEAYLKAGDNEKAITNYKKSVELNPGNQGGINALEKLGVKTKELIKEIVVDEKILESYVGKYEVMEGFVVDISKEGNQLKAQPVGQPIFSIHPLSENVFFLKEVEAQLTFNKNDQGMIDSLTLIQGGREVTGPRLK